MCAPLLINVSVSVCFYMLFFLYVFCLWFYLCHNNRSHILAFLIKIPFYAGLNVGVRVPVSRPQDKSCIFFKDTSMVKHTTVPSCFKAPEVCFMPQFHNVDCQNCLSSLPFLS